MTVFFPPALLAADLAELAAIAALLLPVAILGAMIWMAWKRYRRMQPAVTLEAVPDDVKSGLVDQTDDAREWWQTYEAFAVDFERTGHPFQFRQLIDLMACGPVPLAVAASETLADSTWLGRYGSDRELRNEMAEITGWNLRMARSRRERASLLGLLTRLADLAEHRPDALEVWLAHNVGDVTAADPVRRAHAAFVLARLGTPEMREQVSAAATDDSLVRAEKAAADAGSPADAPDLPELPSPGDPLPSYAVMVQQGAG